jgi:putative ABC transport system permease protein
MLGIVLGIASFVAVLGLTTTASGQIDKRFNELLATEVTVTDNGGRDPRINFPADADQRLARLNGVVNAGVFWSVPVKAQISTTPPGSLDSDSSSDSELTVVAASPGALLATRPKMGKGVLYNEFHQSRKERVAVLGESAAAQLDVRRIDGQPAIFINGVAYTVVGIIADVERKPELLRSVMIPSSTALAAYGPPAAGSRARMIIDTALGAAGLVASQAPLALRPDWPELFSVVTPAEPRELSKNVSSDLDALFLALAGICLVVGAFAIANITLIGVLERTGEIGLRRALGGQRRHIASQFLAEGASLGLLGGLIGTSVGVLVVIVVAMVREWSAILEPWVVLPAPLVGAAVGLLAGLYPALRAAWIEPLEALRR